MAIHVYESICVSSTCRANLVCVCVRVGNSVSLLCLSVSACVCLSVFQVQSQPNSGIFQGPMEVGFASKLSVWKARPICLLSTT